MLNDEGRITSTREPSAGPGPLFSLVRGATGCAWAVRADVPEDIACELDDLAREEPPILDLRDAPVHAQRYVSLLEGRMRPAKLCESGGPAFTFPDAVAQPAGVRAVEDERLLQHHFRGWVAGEIAAGRSPVMAATLSVSPPQRITSCTPLR